MTWHIERKMWRKTRPGQGARMQVKTGWSATQICLWTNCWISIAHSASVCLARPQFYHLNFIHSHTHSFITAFIELYCQTLLGAEAIRVRNQILSSQRGKVTSYGKAMWPAPWRAQARWNGGAAWGWELVCSEGLRERNCGPWSIRVHSIRKKKSIPDLHSFSKEQEWSSATQHGGSFRFVTAPCPRNHCHPWDSWSQQRITPGQSGHSGPQPGLRLRGRRGSSRVSLGEGRKGPSQLLLAKGRGWSCWRHIKINENS